MRTVYGLHRRGLMRSLLVLAIMLVSVLARAQPIVSLFGGGSKLIGSPVTSADLGFECGAAVGWSFPHLEHVPDGPDVRLAWGPEITVAYSHWVAPYADLFALTVAPGIRAGVVKGAWTLGLASHIGYVRGSGELLAPTISPALGYVPPATQQGVVFEFGPGLDLALGRRWVLRAEAVLHVGFSSGSATWLTFGPSLGLTL